MREKAIIVTNNLLAKQSFYGKFDVDFIDGSLMDVLIRTRDYIHLKHRLLTHPLAGSIKPNETPYKTIAISLEKGSEVDLDSLNLIENSMQTAQKLLKNKAKINWSKEVLEDFKLIDFDLINNAFQ